PPTGRPRIAWPVRLLLRLRLGFRFGLRLRLGLGGLGLPLRLRPLLGAALPARRPLCTTRACVRPLILDLGIAGFRGPGEAQRVLLLVLKPPRADRGRALPAACTVPRSAVRRNAVPRGPVPGGRGGRQ